MDTEALIAAVRAGDIEAAQALLPVDPIVKRARGICARHMGAPSRWLDGSHDDGPYMGAVTEALRASSWIDADQILRMARAAVFVLSPDGLDRLDYLNGVRDMTPQMVDVRKAIEAALG